MKTVVITGAASGIGLSTAKLLSSHMNVIVADRNYSGATLLANEIIRNGGYATAMEVDVTNATSVSRLAEDVIRIFGRVDALFCNAGISSKSPIEKCEESLWDEVIATHIKGVFFCTQRFLPQMCKQRSGAIVTSGSDYSIVGHRYGAPYAAAKAGIYSLTKSIALEFASFNVRCNAVGPGPIDTPLLRKGMTDEQWMRHKAERSERVPMGRLGDPHEVASVVEFLISDEAAYITGQIVHPNGGSVMW